MTKLFCSWCCHFFSRLHNCNVESDKTLNGVKQNKLLHETKKQTVLKQHNENKVRVSTNLLVRFVVIQLWFLSLVLRREVLHHLLESVFTPMQYDLVLCQFLHNTRRHTQNHMQYVTLNTVHTVYLLCCVTFFLASASSLTLSRSEKTCSSDFILAIFSLSCSVSVMTFVSSCSIFWRSACSLALSITKATGTRTNQSTSSTCHQYIKLNIVFDLLYLPPVRAVAVDSDLFISPSLNLRSCFIDAYCSCDGMWSTRNIFYTSQRQSQISNSFERLI